MKSPLLCTVRFCRNPRHQRRTIRAKHIMREWRATRPLSELLNTIRNRAKKKNISFSLTLTEFTEFCTTNGHDPRRHHIDRINPTQGYHVWNIQVLGCSENIAKGNRERHSERYQAYLAMRKAQLPVEPDCPF